MDNSLAKQILNSDMKSTLFDALIPSSAADVDSASTASRSPASNVGSKLPDTRARSRLASIFSNRNPTTNHVLATESAQDSLSGPEGEGNSEQLSSSAFSGTCCKDLAELLYSVGRDVKLARRPSSAVRTVLVDESKTRKTVNAHPSLACFVISGHTPNDFVGTHGQAGVVLVSRVDIMSRSHGHFMFAWHNSERN